MSKVVGVFEDERTAQLARCLLTDKGCEDAHLSLLAPAEGLLPQPKRLRQRGESMVRGAVRWGIIGALIIEVPSLIILMLLPVDANTKVFMGATVWKFGAAFGAWFGAMGAEERGLATEVAEEYEEHLLAGRWVLSANLKRRDRPAARGAILESDALEVRDVVGTFEIKPSPADRPAKSRS